MDHCEIPEGTNPILIPYVCSDEFDRGDFLTYPSRKGWTEEDLKRPYSCDRPIKEANAFVQSWLYIGFLVSVLGAVGIKAECRDFVRTTSKKSRVISTAALPKFLDQWKHKSSPEERRKAYEVKHGSIKHLWPAERQRRLASSKEEDRLLAIVKRFSENVRHFLPEPSDGHDDAHLSTTEKILISIDLVVIPINEILYELYEWRCIVPSFDGIGHSWAVKRMVSGGWCPLEARALLSNKRFYDQYFFSSFASPRWGLDHGDCTEKACHGRFIGGTYETKHRKEACTCDFVSVPEASFEMVQEHRIPVVSWRNNSGLHVSAYDPDSPRNYVAISHVWSDGMGNENSNSLPACQLSFIQGLVDQLYAEDHPDYPYAWSSGPTNVRKRADGPPIGFWMDTLCVPVHDNKLRKSAIAQMNTIYTQAHRVLVLDSGIMRKSAKSSFSEKTAAICLSNWQARLWTLQEGLLPSNLFFQFKDKPAALDAMIHSKRKKRKLIDISFHLREVPILDFHVDPRNKPKLASTSRFSIVTTPLMRRTTTRKSDETICLATLFDMNPEPLLSIRPQNIAGATRTWEEKQAEDQRVSDLRMAKFLHMVEKFPSHYIFNAYARLPLRGYRWAPRTYLGHFTVPETRRDLREHDRQFPSRVSRCGGLLVKYPGRRMRLDVDTDAAGGRLMVVSDPLAGGLECHVSLCDFHTPKFPPWKRELNYAVISNSPAMTADTERLAILAILDSVTEDGREEEELGGWLKASHVCTVILAYLPSSTPSHGAIRGRFLDPGEDIEKWCVM